VHGNITERAHEVRRLVSYADSAKVTDNLWGERWSKLVANTMANGVSACTGLPGAQIAQNEAIRHFQARLGSEAIRIGEARGYRLEEIDHLTPETIARAGEGDGAALKIYDEGGQVGIQASANERLVDIVKRVERGELKQDPRHITELRLN
jgi:2-dehydropantoate 2-reductase